MRLIFFLFALLFSIAVGAKYSLDYLKNHPFPFEKTKTATIAKQTFKLYVVSSLKDKEIGLSEEPSMPKNYGMLFLFDKPDYYPFWMKNMKFPVDILFIHKNRIVTIYENVRPPKSQTKNPPIFKPKEKADTVLEINAGLAKKYNFKKGDEVKTNI